MKKFSAILRKLVVALAVFGTVEAAVATTDEICLNGPDWSFQPVKVPFYGYELDHPGRWMPAQRSHRFIIDALEDPANDWLVKKPVRVPMSWTSATSEPGSRVATGDFAFPYFWQYVHRGVYEREFAVPARFAGQRIKLWFESVNFRCWIYVNGELVRAEGPEVNWSHENKHPFEVDITAHVKAPSTENRLRIVVHDFTASFGGAFPNEDHPVTGITYPLGDRCDYYNKDRGWRNLDNGIIGDVLLRARSEINVPEVFIRTSVKQSRIEADITLRNEGLTNRTVRVLARATGWKDAAARLDFIESPLIMLAAGETKTLTLAQSWPSPRLWWPHDPFLYKLTVELREGDGVVASTEQRFGFREVEMVTSIDPDQRGFYLNGVRTRLLGESVEPTWKDGYTEGVGTSGLYLYNPEYWSALIDEAKRLNISVLRTHRGMWLEQMFTTADEKGMLMIAESTINNGNHKGGNGTIENQRRAVRDMIRTLRNHPSVVIWSLANESPFNEVWAEEARLHDNTRPYVATQVVPRNHPSPSLAAASGSYAMGLNGYEPRIYGRHDANWKNKPLYIYEDNAGYDHPADEDRMTAVQKGLTILRGHRSSGYEVVFTFYTWQKLYGQPREAGQKLRPLSWSEAETRSRGYRPDFARMSLIDPWSDSKKIRILRPLEGFADRPEDFWIRTFSPVAVFDRDYDQRTAIAANPYAAPLGSARTLIIHNDDLVDRSTAIRVTWTVRADADGRVLSEGEFIQEVPLGGVRSRGIQIDAKDSQAVHVTYRAFKSGRDRFREIVALRHMAITEQIVAAISVGAEAHKEYVLSAAEGSVETKGYRREKIAGQWSKAVLMADGTDESAYVRFRPAVAPAGEYDVYLHVPPGFQGTQTVEILHDTVTTGAAVDLGQPGWVKLTATPVRMEAGSLENSVRIGRGATAKKSVVDAIKLVRVR